jgi:hypothetical protein
MSLVSLLDDARSLALWTAAAAQGAQDTPQDSSTAAVPRFVASALTAGDRGCCHAEMEMDMSTAN